ncbi:hypothetical protein AGLY_011821 [Aphis glycines]|uniref:Uncharacterized protein n=1 Tax=Aphis glycines TaxID=307491 RepID=A0A6G0TBP6_APHGL|nr:hypothetical protein AGLY_011821 [Aphis glycines]
MLSATKKWHTRRKKDDLGSESPHFQKKNIFIRLFIMIKFELILVFYSYTFILNPKRFNFKIDEPPQKPKAVLEERIPLIILCNSERSDECIDFTMISNFYEICRKRDNLQRNDNDLSSNDFKYLLLFQNYKSVDEIFLAQSKYLKIKYKVLHIDPLGRKQSGCMLSKSLSILVAFVVYMINLQRYSVVN